VDYTSNWDDVRAKLEGEPAFEAITLESERVRIFKVDAENIKCKL
jgi:pre-mRNA-processing factor 40